MDHFPDPRSGSAGCRLPLSAATARRIADALLEPPGGERAEQWSAALGQDPCFTLWVLWAASARGQDELRTLGAAVHWLEGQGIALWKCLLERPGNKPQAPDPAKLTGLVRQSVRLAGLARRLAAEEVADEAHLAGLLSMTGECLRLATPKMSMRRAGVPAWLATLLRRAGALDSQKQRPGRSKKRPSLRAAAENLPTPHRALAEARALAESRLRTSPELKLRLAETEQAAGAAADCLESGSAAAGEALVHLVGRLARLDDLESRFERVLEHAKLEAMAEFAAGAGHEINNPLMVISGRVQLFLRGENDPERRRMFATLNRQTLRVSEMISDMMLFARPPLPRAESIDLRILVTDVFASLADEALHRQITLSLSGDESPLVIAADPAQIAVVLRALCDNACEAIGQSGTIEIELSRTESSPGAPAAVEIRIRDDGCGVDPAVREHLFDPYHSGREAGRGLGLGLAKCWRIVTMHGGTIDVASQPGQGAIFTVRLPVQATPQPLEHPSP